MFGLLLLLFCIVLVKILIDSTDANTQETFLSRPQFPTLVDNYQQRMDEIVNTDRVLDRVVKAGKRIIQDITPKAATKILSDDFQKLSRPRRNKLNFKDVKRTKLADNSDVYDYVNERQPYMFDEAHIAERYGKLYYWDWRFPKKLIDIRFAKDPVGYCKKYPNSYPAYVINSRLWKQ